ncbi:hypothetical protein B0H13DRAFT_2006005 [Mycena leptocephala]|nr:hypothetical protein B0H13DRAFT_2006005 [Mycena leptocephala]
MEDTSAKNGVQHWQPSTAIANDLEALYAQSEIEKTKFAEKLVKKHPRKRKHGVLDTSESVGLPPAIAEDSDSREQITNFLRTRRSRRIAESATEPEASAMALVEPRPGPRSRDSACAHNETDSAVAVIGGSEALASRGSKRCRVSSTSRPSETVLMNDAFYVGRGNASGAVSFGESGQTADGSGNTNGEQRSGIPFLHPSMPQNDGSTPIGFSGAQTATAVRVPGCAKAGSRRAKYAMLATCTNRGFADLDPSSWRLGVQDRAFLPVVSLDVQTVIAVRVLIGARANSKLVRMFASLAIVTR